MSRRGVDIPFIDMYDNSIMINYKVAKFLVCDICSHTWVTRMENELPKNCAGKACRSRRWNGEDARLRRRRSKVTDTSAT